jgi:hypothetical protein
LHSNAICFGFTTLNRNYSPTSPPKQQLMAKIPKMRQSASDRSICN